MENLAILLIDDDADFRNYARRSLENEGFDVLDIPDGNNLELILKGFKVDLILCDTDLGSDKGYDFCKNAIEKGWIDDSIYIVAMSGDQENQKYWAGIANFNGFYNKLNFEKIEVGLSIANYLRVAKSNPLIYGSKMLFVHDSDPD